MFDSEMSNSAGAVERSDSASAPVPTTVRSTNNETGTNVQETGVDEPDVVKVAGDKLFRIQDNVLTTYDVAGDEPQQLSSMQLPDLRNGEILVSGDRVVVLGDLGGQYDEATGARIVVDRREPARNTPDRRADRLHRDHQRGPPARRRRPGRPRQRPPDARLHATPTAATASGRPSSATASWSATPRWPTGCRRSTASRSSTATTSRSPTMETALGTTTVVTFEPAVVEPTATAVATTATTSYFSPDRFYLAASGSPFGWWGSRR